MLKPLKYLSLLLLLCVFENIKAQDLVGPDPSVNDTGIKIKRYTQVELMPVFNCGNYTNMYEFIANYLIYPDIALDDEIEGTAHVSFVVSSTGKVIEVKVAKSSGFKSLDDAALNVVKKMCFTPGKHRGMPVEVIYEVPISFKIDH